MGGLADQRTLHEIWRTWTHKRRAATVFLGVALVFVFFARPARKVWHGNDYAVYHAAGRVILEGGDPYTAHSEDGRPYIYPPTLAVLMAPISLLPERVGGLLWLVAKLLLLAWCLRTLSRHLVPIVGVPAWGVPALALAVLYTIVDNELCNGQADLWVLGCIVYAFQAILRTRETRAGLAIALAAALKVTPLFLGLWLLRRRSVRGLVGLAAGLVLFLFVVPALAMGPARAWAANVDYVQFMVAPYAQGGVHEKTPPREMPGYSIRAASHRWLAEPQEEGLGEDAGVHALTLSARTAEWIYRIVGVLLVLLTWLATRHRTDAHDAGGVLRELALFAATMVIVAPLSRVAHFVVLLPATSYLAAVWLRHKRRMDLFVLVASTLLINVPFLFLPRTAKLVVAGNGALLVGALLIWLACLRGAASTQELE